MNPRIQELIAKANGTPVELVEITSWAFAERLAKLVVRECMDVVDPGQNQVIARYQARQWLAEHFGVDE